MPQGSYTVSPQNLSEAKSIADEYGILFCSHAAETQAEQNDINKYFLSVLIFIISLLTITSLFSIFGINFEQSFKLGILTLMNTVNSSMYDLNNFDFLQLNYYSKLTMIVFMIIGRVELLTILIIIKKFIFKS